MRLQSVRLAQVVRQERFVGLMGGDNTFLHIEQQQMVEVQCSRLEYTHHLQIGYRLAVERQRDLLHVPHYQPAQQVGLPGKRLHRLVAQDSDELQECAPRLVKRLALHVPLPGVLLELQRLF